jgi:uncharacterized protein
MSEFIDNTTKRKNTLKNILRQLHEGKTADEVKAEFAELVQEADANEIAEVEQILIEEGLPVEEVQRLCDVHVAVFRDSLDEQPQPGMTPGHPVHTFIAENSGADKALIHLREAIDQLIQHPDISALNLVHQTLAVLKEYEVHYLRKENLLFSFLEKYSFKGPSQVMWGIHNDVRDQWKALSTLLGSAPDLLGEPFKQQVESSFLAMEHNIREMFYKEEKILYPAALERLSETDWMEIRAQEADLGYCFITPGDSWQPKTSSLMDTAQALIQETQAVQINPILNLVTGQLTHEQLNLMLANLPVDITFVDENDEVRFFSETRDRVFPRSPAIIGRKVQNCHPPQSVDRVQRIVEDFRAGKRDEAEFWIQMQERFIHIRYFALRDETKAYRGVLEITQDISSIRTLEGERRIMDETPA